MTVDAAPLPVLPISTMPNNDEEHDELKVFKTEGDADATNAPSADLIGDDKKDIGILAEQDQDGPLVSASKPVTGGAPWNPALQGPSTSKLQPPPKAFRPTPKHPSSLPSTSGDNASPMSVYVPGAFPQFLFPMTPSQWTSMAHIAQMQRNFSPLAGAPSPQTNFSPLPSPNTGTPIQVQPPKTPAQTASEQMMQQMQQQMMAANKQFMASMQQSGVALPPSFGQRLGVGNPLMSLGSLSVPQVPRSVTSLANSLAAESERRERPSKKEHKEREPRRHRDKDNEHHIKKPLNAFMLFMKENRAKMQEQKGFKERQSAELNKEMGRMWHLLSQDEQQKYYQMAKEERVKHQQQFPGWSARDNYAIHKKKKKRRDKTAADPESLEMKKCRARFGLDNQAKWCKHCKRKKKCLWFREGPNGPVSHQNGHHHHHGEQSPAQVSSTTQGSPQDSETSTASSLAHLSVATALNLAAAGRLPSGPPLAKRSRLDGPTHSPSSVVSSTTHHKSEKDEGEDSDEDEEEDEDSGDEEESGSEEEGPEDLSAHSHSPHPVSATRPVDIANNNKPQLPPPLPPQPSRPIHASQA